MSNLHTSSNSYFCCADLCDEHIQTPQRCNVVQPNLLHNYGGKMCFHGKIVTIRCLESNVLVRKTLSSEEGKGKVLVVDSGGSTRVALFGDRLASLALLQGWEGVVINGCVRDSAILRTMQVGIKAIGTTPVKSSKDHPGDKDVKVSFGGVEFVPGHWIYADEVGTQHWCHAHYYYIITTRLYSYIYSCIDTNLLPYLLESCFICNAGWNHRK
jgi:regulator of ribonuclease activity A